MSRAFDFALSLPLAAMFFMPCVLAQRQPGTKPVEEKPSEPESKQSDSGKRIELNLLGKTDAAAGESRRNENIQFNLVDNNALKGLNVRLGTTATTVREFTPARNHFGAEVGNAPSATITNPQALSPGFHGKVHYAHLNSVFSARSFFQVGDVKQHAVGLSVASRTTGVNVNLLAADGPDGIERVSGMAHLTGFPVEVRPAAGPLEPRSWSGMPVAPGR